MGLVRRFWLRGSEVIINVKKLSHGVEIPIRQTASSSGFDLCADIFEAITINPGERKKIPTGLAFEIPVGYEGQVRPRSGLSLNHGVVASLGTIDADYRGEVSVILYNNSFVKFEVKPGMRVAQLVICPVAYPELQEVDSLTDTNRGTSGFGSTGL
jgi:dUTP pyrophosphatase